MQDNFRRQVGCPESSVGICAEMSLSVQKGLEWWTGTHAGSLVHFQPKEFSQVREALTWHALCRKQLIMLFTLSIQNKEADKASSQVATSDSCQFIGKEGLGLHHELVLERRVDVEVHVVDSEVQGPCRQAAGLQDLGHGTHNLPRSA